MKNLEYLLQNLKQIGLELLLKISRKLKDFGKFLGTLGNSYFE